MTFFVMFVSVPAFLFCCVALVHFQREIVKSEKAEWPVGRKVSLDRLDDVDSGSVCGTRTSENNTQGEVYQLESPYLGPFFVVRNENGRDWRLTNTSDEYHRVLSASRG